jgi:MFS family permease
MANATIAPSLPSQRQNYVDVASIDTLAGLIITLPSLAVVFTAGMIGWLADKFDRQQLLLMSGLLYAVGGTSGLWVDSLPQLLVGRLVLGIGVAGMMVLATTWAGDLWAGPARARFLGRQGAVMSAGGVVVVLVGGALASLHWRGAFATYLLVIPIATLAYIALRPYTKERATLTLHSVSGDATLPWSSFIFTGALAFTFMVMVYVMPTRLPFLLGERGVSNPFVVAIVMSTATVFSLPGSLLYGSIRKKLSPQAVFAIAWTLMGSGMLLVALSPVLPLTIVGGCYHRLGHWTIVAKLYNLLAQHRSTNFARSRGCNADHSLFRGTVCISSRKRSAGIPFWTGRQFRRIGASAAGFVRHAIFHEIA